MYHNEGMCLVRYLSWMGMKVSQLPVIESENLLYNLGFYELTLMIVWVFHEVIIEE